MSLVVYDSSPDILANHTTGCPHTDLYGLPASESNHLLELVVDEDVNVSEAALDGLGSIAVRGELENPNYGKALHLALAVMDGHPNVTVREAGRDLARKLRGKELEPPQLLDSTRYKELDIALMFAIDRIETLLPGKVSAYYLVGSYASGHEVAASDLDLHLVFNGTPSEHDCAVLDTVGKTFSRCGVEIDLIPFSTPKISGFADPRTKLEGRLLYGEDLLREVPLPEIKVYTLQQIDKALSYLQRIRDHVSLHNPATAPNPDGEWLGYDHRINPDGSKSTKEFVSSAGWIATALCAIENGTYIPSKSACLSEFMKIPSNSWSEHLQIIFGDIRGTWDYKIPKEASDKAKLKSICKNEVTFEQMFIDRCYEYLTKEILRPDISPQLLVETTALLNKLPKIERSPVQFSQLDPTSLTVKIHSVKEMSTAQISEAMTIFGSVGFVILESDPEADHAQDLISLQRLLGDKMGHPRANEHGVVRIAFEEGRASYDGTQSKAQEPHTDGAFLGLPPRVIALTCDRASPKGGDSILVSGDELYDSLFQLSEPDLDGLFSSQAYHIRRDQDEMVRPVLDYHGNKVHLSFKSGGGAEVTVDPVATTGFQTIRDFVNHPENQLRFRLKPHQTLIIDNTRHLHGRTAFPECGGRLMYRMWYDGNSKLLEAFGSGIRK